MVVQKWEGFKVLWSIIQSKGLTVNSVGGVKGSFGNNRAAEDDKLNKRCKIKRLGHRLNSKNLLQWQGVSI